MDKISFYVTLGLSVLWSAALLYYIFREFNYVLRLSMSSFPQISSTRKSFPRISKNIIRAFFTSKTIFYETLNGNFKFYNFYEFIFWKVNFEQLVFE